MPCKGGDRFDTTYQYNTGSGLLESVTTMHGDDLMFEEELFYTAGSGAEFVAKYLTRMQAVKGVTCHHIDPGSPWQNAYASYCTSLAA
jgi:hypothetical protein